MGKWLELVEIRTKLASLLPFGIGILLAVTRWHSFDWANTALFFVAMLGFDMLTTAINNLMDYHKAKDPDYRRHVNVIGRTGMNPSHVAAGILLGLAATVAVSLGLVARTHWFLLLIGAACFAIGIFYTFGPLPLSRLPLGEVFSGVTMGLGIPFIAVYVNVPARDFLAVDLAWPQLVVDGSLPGLLALGLTAVLPMALIANVMLANNLADYEQDVANHRLTLPMYLGKPASGWLYRGLAVVGYPAIGLAVVSGLVTPWCLVTWLSLPAVWRNAQRFVARPDKATTFGTAIANLVLGNGSLLAGLAIAAGVGA